MSLKEESEWVYVSIWEGGSSGRSRKHIDTKMGNLLCVKNIMEAQMEM